MNNTSYHVWVATQLEPDMKLHGSRNYRKRKEPEQDYKDYYERNRKYLEQSLREQEEAEDNYLAKHNAG